MLYLSFACGQLKTRSRQDAHLVSYGAMSKSPIPLSTSLFIFKNLTCHGYWQSRWYRDHSKEERTALLSEVMDLLEQKKVGG